MTTFLVNDRGNIYEKDLGSRTAAIASGMTSFDRHLAAGDPSGSVPDCAALGRVLNPSSRRPRAGVAVADVLPAALAGR